MFDIRHVPTFTEDNTHKYIFIQKNTLFQNVKLKYGFKLTICIKNLKI